jgi:putative DNA primase/helicase
MNQKPHTLKGDLAHLPAALVPLTVLDHWVCWRWELCKGTWTKPPLTPAGKRARNNDSGTWSPYQAALAAVQNGRTFDGIGFALLDTPFDCVDLDHCLDPATGRVDEWANVWLDAPNGTYVERTPSGEGLRIIGGAGDTQELHRKWPVPGARNRAAIEIYRNTARYITVTGIQVGECKELGQANGLLERIRAHFDAQHRGQKGKRKTGATAYDDVIRNGAPDGTDASALFHSVIGHLCSQGMTLDEIVEELSRWPHGIGQRYAGRLRQEVERSFEKWQVKRRITPGAPNEPDEPAVWDKIDRKGIPKPTRTNTRRALRALGIVCRYDSFHDRFIIAGESGGDGKDLKETALRLGEKILKAFRFEPGVRPTEEAIIQLALRNAFDPVADYVNSLTWDGKPRLECWFITYLGAEDTELNREFGRLVMIAAVRRIRHPGTKFDPIVVLEGLMRTQKSMAIETMAGAIKPSSARAIRSNRSSWPGSGYTRSPILRTSGRPRSSTSKRLLPAPVTAPGRLMAIAVSIDRGAASCSRPPTMTNTSRHRIEGSGRCAQRQLISKRSGVTATSYGRKQHSGSRKAHRSCLIDDYGKQPALSSRSGRRAIPGTIFLCDVIATVNEGEERVLTKELYGTVLGFSNSRLRDMDAKRIGRCMRRLGWSGPRKMRVGNEEGRGYSRPKR